MYYGLALPCVVLIFWRLYLCWYGVCHTQETISKLENIIIDSTFTYSVLYYTHNITSAVSAEVTGISTMDMFATTFAQWLSDRIDSRTEYSIYIIFIWLTGSGSV